MIPTIFENMNDINLDNIEVIMPHPVRVGEAIDFNDASWTVTSVTWIINADPENFTRTVKLHARIR